MKKILAIIILALAAVAIVTMFCSIMSPLHEAVKMGVAVVGGLMAVLWALKVLIMGGDTK